MSEENYAAVACAVQNLMVAAQASGIGVGWSTGKVCKPTELAATLGLVESARVARCLYIGYTSVEVSSSRRDSANVTNWL